MTAFDEASVRAIILQVQGWGDRHMITAHDRDIPKRLPEWNPTGDITAQRRAWEELATIYNQDLPAGFWDINAVAKKIKK